MKTRWMGGREISEVKKEAGRREWTEGEKTEDRGGKEGGKEGDWQRGGRRKIKRGERESSKRRKEVRNECDQHRGGRREWWIKERMVEKSEGWREGGRDGEPLIIYDSLSFSKQPSGPAPCFPLTFNLSENQRAWSLIIVSVCQRLCFNLPDTEVRSQAVLYTHVSLAFLRLKQSSIAGPVSV